MQGRILAVAGRKVKRGVYGQGIQRLTNTAGKPARFILKAWRAKVGELAERSLSMEEPSSWARQGISLAYCDLYRLTEILRFAQNDKNCDFAVPIPPLVCILDIVQKLKYN